MTTTLTGKNQVTVPVEITQRLGLAPGTQFDWAVGNRPNKIVITIKPTRKQLLERVRALGRKARRPGEDPIGKGILIGDRHNMRQSYRIIGVIPELRAKGLDQPPSEAVFSAEPMSEPVWIR